MDQAEPQPLPGQPQRYRPGRPQRRWLRPAADPAADQAVGQSATGWPDRPPGDPAHPDHTGHGAGDPAQPPAGGSPTSGSSTGGPAPGGPAIGDPLGGALDDWARWEADTHPPLGETDHPVLVGYDGSEPSRHALAYAAGLARRLGRSLLVAYVTTPGVFCEPLSGQVIAAVRDSTETQRWLLAELDDGCDRTGLDVRIVTRQGRPARELATLAAEFSADALVIGAPGGLWHHIAGSVPAWLTRHAQCPVIVVP